MLKQATKKFEAFMRANAEAVENALDEALSKTPLGDELSRPKMLVDAMRHGSLNGGKRLRPFLLIQTAKAFGGDENSALRVATALECVHCYSLVHDDLPAMDDDDLRRGKPTVHIAYDEATAILAGDGLLTLSFDILASSQTDIDPTKKILLISKLAQASGMGGMVGGQMYDLTAEKEQLSDQDILLLQQMKTGALIRYACEAGAIVGDANEADIINMKKFGQIIGQAFQLSDDILDITSDTDKMGKKTGKDADRGKATLVSLHGLDWAKTKLDDLLGQSKQVLSKINNDTEILEATAEFIIKRDN